MRNLGRRGLAAGRISANRARPGPGARRRRSVGAAAVLEEVAARRRACALTMSRRTRKVEFRRRARAWAAAHLSEELRAERQVAVLVAARPWEACGNQNFIAARRKNQIHWLISTRVKTVLEISTRLRAAGLSEGSARRARRRPVWERLGAHETTARFTFIFHAIRARRRSSRRRAAALRLDLGEAVLACGNQPVSAKSDRSTTARSSGKF